MVSRSISFEGLSTASVVKPVRVGRHGQADNSAMTVWDEDGNEVFGDVDFEITGGAERHFLNLVSDQSNIIS